MKIIIFLLLFVMGFQCYAQLGDSRFYSNFYLKAIQIDGETTTITSNDELNLIDFNFLEGSDNFVMSACRIGEAAISPESFAFTLAPDFIWTGTVCQDPVNIEIEDTVFNFFQDNATETFSLSVGYFGTNDDDIFMTIGVPNGDNLYFDTLPILSTESFVNKNAVVLFPNPVEDVLSISTSNDSVLKIELFNALGNKVISQTMANSTELSLARLTSGLYFVSIMDEAGNVQIKKIVKK